MMKDKSPVNIVVPVYNVADLLSRCVDSLLAQTYEDVRIVLVDDGSTDDCPAICDRYAEQDPRVTSLHRTNGGLSAARNTGIDHVFSIEEPSRGRYIAFVDSDDWDAGGVRRGRGAVRPFHLLRAGQRGRQGPRPHAHDARPCASS